MLVLEPPRMTPGYGRKLIGIYLRACRRCPHESPRCSPQFMSAPANTRSFRTRLALQTMIVAGLLVAGFGTAAWWYASQTLERSVDDRIIAPAQRIWNRIDPHTTDEQFKMIADLVFGTSADRNSNHAVLIVQEHNQGKTLFATPNAPKDLDVYFRSCFPTPEEIGNAPPMGHGGPPGRRPPPPRNGEFDDFLGTPGFDPEPPPQERNLPFRPQMPMVREPTTFTARSGGIDWRFGAFSSPTYTIFIGLSLTDF